MTGTLFVDGFNLFYARDAVSHPYLSDVAAMLYAIESYAAFKGMSACVVLDGARFHRQFNDSRVLRILCSGSRRTADSVLESEMYGTPEADRLPSILVTDDRNLADMAAGLGVRHVRCRVFLKDLEDAAAGGRKREGSRPGDREPWSERINRPFDKL